MTRYKDITGQRFGRLVAVKRLKEKWLCKCDCGNESETLLYSLESGRAKSCGCYNREEITLRNTKHGMANQRDQLYRAWLNMRHRCLGTNNPDYKHYGGRGVKISKKWDDYTKFKEWSEHNGFEQGLTLDRIDNDGDYSEDNCRWVDRKVQGNNRRTNIVIEINGVKANLKQHAKMNGLNYGTVRTRYSRDGKRGQDVIRPVEERYKRK